MRPFDHFEIYQWQGPNYLNEIFQTASESNRTLRNDYCKLQHQFHKTAGQNLLSFLETSKWSKLTVYKKVEHHEHFQTKF